MQCKRPRFDSWVGKVHWRRDRLPTLVFLGFPSCSAGKESACDAGAEKAMAPHSSTLAWEIPWTEGPDRLAVHGVIKSRTWVNDFTFTFHFHSLEKEMATHSSVPAWRIPGTGEPGGLLSMGLCRVGHDWSDLAAAAMQETWVQSLGWEDPLEKGKVTTPVFWSGEFHGLYSPWGCKELDSERCSLSLFYVLNNYAVLPLTVTHFVKCNIDRLWNIFYALKKCRVLSHLL